MSPALNRAQAAELYRPIANKKVATYVLPGGTFPIAANANAVSVVQSIDLTIPIRGFRGVAKGRVNVTTAAYTNINPESLLNYISNILITAVNKRQNGNVTLINCDLASWYGFTHLTNYRIGQVRVNGVVAFRPSVPYTIAASPNGTALFNGAIGAYDFIIQFDIPSAPIGLTGMASAVNAGFLIRQTEYKDTIDLVISTPAFADNTANPFGTSGATTVTSLFAFGTGSGTPTFDLYTLPVIMGSQQNQILPGVLNRAVRQITPSLLASGVSAPTEILRLQKKITPRIYIKTGIGTAYPVFTSLSDSVLTTLGLQVGTDKNVRDPNDWEAMREEYITHYEVDPVQGYNILDFMQASNPDASYPAHRLGDGATFSVVATWPNTANALCIIMQEQILHEASGALAGT